MAKRRRPDFDMFDVASGKVSLEDYLNQRYSEVDLQSSVWVDPKDDIDELLAPPAKDEPPVVRPYNPAPEPEPTVAETVPPEEGPIDFEALVNRFHQAAQEYQERNPGEEDG